jgi:hypothetical protein
MPLTLFTLVILQIGSRIDALAGSPPIYAFHVAGMTGVHHCTQLLIEMGSCEVFAWYRHKPPCMVMQGFYSKCSGK